MIWMRAASIGFKLAIKALRIISFDHNFSDYYSEMLSIGLLSQQEIAVGVNNSNNILTFLYSKNE